MCVRGEVSFLRESVGHGGRVRGRGEGAPGGVVEVCACRRERLREEWELAVVVVRVEVQTAEEQAAIGAAGQ